MMKIGDFSLLTNRPVKTLRYYDDIGLLKPAQKTITIIDTMGPTIGKS